MYEVKKLDDEIVKKIETKELFDFIEIYEVNIPKNKCVLISKYLDKYLEEVKSFKVYEDDIWVISIPKSGTTWTEEMAWLINNNLDYDTALNKKLNKRSSFLE
ncbi:hypothetical protein PVAND_016705 [Polypedilum vanderplanki]|uniref:Sulfotransferase domain-containing protein n=1 Tax=Polypedilum vanderplanki TaxID=319348 RepID=A0A9J6BGZ2_POLVA|nr:hypothetical protein PVAND_016705 [Polypedilum vanderplanki]